ncbi:NAD+ synthase [Synechococcus sp. RSCCF101]|uniref:NAD+ synthase n=1 Tax=Synechococcus sp. RSCCF101 TaxID=2511069 RepID=UPI001244A0ED|nr:NAD+ synthase [Synechococcus sp. RSCCF101]QEY33558.1 NAD+ synthase [Synechococcus sp. RSCCF101]
MRLALAQLNPTVGDLQGNADRILSACRDAARQGASLVLTPELSLWGYPPRDLLLRPSLLEAQQRALDRLAAAMPADLTALVGVVEGVGDGRQPALFNAIAAVRADGWRMQSRKRLLPSYDVFDEQRYFRSGGEAGLLRHETAGRAVHLGLTLCEDLWVDEALQEQRLHGADPVAELAGRRPDLLVNLSASPYGRGKSAIRRRLAGAAARRLGCPVVYVNQVGGNDELVFDGGSFVVGADGAVLLQLPHAESCLAVWASDDAQAPAPGAVPAIEPLEEVFRVLVLGVRDYARKCGFRSALLGLSGGIDSALVAVISAAALGPERVRTLLMPSPYSSEGSWKDAEALANRLDLRTDQLPIAPLMEAFDGTLTAIYPGGPAGVAAENLQSRIRGTLLMALANQEGGLLLSTGNKSELAVGYCTLYGDMNGGLAVIGDLYKSTVFALCDWLDSPASRGCRRELGLPDQVAPVGEAIRRKPPSAELRPDQKDSDSLPPYERLDPILRAMIDDHRTPEELIAEGMEPDVCRRVDALMRRAEFKRRQAPPVLKVSRQAFGGGWRMPIAAGG